MNPKGCRSSWCVLGLTLFVLLSQGFNMAAQTKASREKIPAGIPADVRAAIEQLYSPDAVTRAEAAKDLGKMGERAAPAILFLIGLLGDHIELEYRSSPDQGILGRPTTSPAGQAIRALVAIGTPAVELLIAALEDADFVQPAAWALGQIRDPRAYVPLKSLLSHPNESYRRSAAEALGNLGDPRAAEDLIGLLRDPSTSARYGAAKALGQLKDRRATEPLIAALNAERNDSVRGPMVEALGELGDPRAVDSLLTLLKRGTQPWRVESVDALGKINDPRALEAVFAALKDKDEFVRGSASVGLAGTRAPERIKALIQALQSEDPVLQDAAALALEKISGKVYGKDTARWQKWWEDNKDSLSHKQ